MIALTGGFILGVAACNGVGAANSGTATTKTVTTVTSDTNSTSSGSLANSSADSTTLSGTTTADTVKSDMFTDRDKDASYDEASATKVNLSEVKDSNYTITKEGTYILSGSYSGQIVVNVADTAKVQLVLDGVTITNESSAAIYVKEADKVFVTLKDGTTSTLTTSGTFVATDDNNVDGVIFSKGDLTINGRGSLKISSTAHGIVGKDDVVITGGNIDITSTKKGISGKDSVRIADGTINITTGTDGIHSENSDDTSKGFVYIEGGTITINAADDGIHSGTTVNIKDSKGNVLASYTPSKEYNSVIISTAGMVQGETYTVTAGTTTKEVTLSQLVSGSGNGMDGPGGGAWGGQGGGMNGGPGGNGNGNFRGPGGNEGGSWGNWGDGMNGHRGWNEQGDRDGQGRPDGAPPSGDFGGWDNNRDSSNNQNGQNG